MVHVSYVTKNPILPKNPKFSHDEMSIIPNFILRVSNIFLLLIFSQSVENEIYLYAGLCVLVLARGPRLSNLMV